MAVRYHLTPELRTRLKKPLGELMRGSPDELVAKFKEMVENQRPTSVIAVGDTVSRNLSEAHVATKIEIIDNKCMRKRVSQVKSRLERTTYVENPPGTITDEAISAVEEAIDSTETTRIVVDGEEDLLALVAIEYAPENSMIVYGQPFEGVVVVRVNAASKKQTSEILQAMKSSSKP